MTTSDASGIPDVQTLTRMANAALAAYEKGLGDQVFHQAQGASPVPGIAGHFPVTGPGADFAGTNSVPDPKPHAQFGGAPPSHPGMPATSPVAPPPLSFSPEPASTIPAGSAPTGVIPALVSPESLGFPGEATLRQLLGSNLSSAPQLPSQPSSAASSPFYFLDHAKTGLASGPLPSAGSSPSPGSVAAPFDLNVVRADFPILNQSVNGKPLVWLDNAATTQKPRQVIERLREFYERENSNVHRAAHELAARSSDAYEEARKKLQRFLGAASPNEIVWVRGATEGINLVAQSWGRANIGAGDEIVVSNLEHHANIVPWQMLAAQKGAKIQVIPVNDAGELLLDEYAKRLGPRTKIVAVTQVSNALGTVTPVRQIADMAHAAGAKVLIDGAQAVSHMPVNVQAIGADWYVMSGHKVFGPTGIGVLYGREDLLNESPPWQGGGNMIQDVTFGKTQYHKAPGRFEAGTGNIADAVGLGAAIDYVTKLGMHHIASWEHQLLHYGTHLLKGIAGLRLVGTAAEKAGVLSFVLEGYKTEEVGALLNQDGIAVRSGHHCAQPILRRLGLEATVRPSLAFYNTCAELDTLAESVSRLASRRGAKTISMPGLRGV